MKNIFNWERFILEQKNSVSETTTTTSTTTLNPNIEYDTDKDGNSIEFNKRTREEIIYHHEKMDSKGKRLIIKRGKYNSQNKKEGTWIEWDPDEQIQHIKNYASDKLDGYSIQNYKNPKSHFEMIKTRWVDDKMIDEKIEYRDGESEMKQFIEGDKMSYKFTIFDNNKKPKKEGYYNKGIKDDLWRWYKDGVFLCSMSYTSGKPDGWGKNPDNETIRGREPEEK